MADSKQKGKEEIFKEKDNVFALNLKYKDGTRLRSHPASDSTFNGVWVQNDTAVTVEMYNDKEDFYLVTKSDGQSGWIRGRNLTKENRKSGVTKGVPHNQVVTPDPEYCMGTKIYGVGIKQDPIPGVKFGKGIQHLTSAYWVTDMAKFIAANFPALQEILRHAKRGSDKTPGYDFVYLINMANHIFNQADVTGLKSNESRELWLMATWLVMAAAEVDNGPFRKYSQEDRKQQREDFYNVYFNPRPGPGTTPGVERENAAILGKFAVPHLRVDLLPMMAMERLGVNNELSALKYPDAEQPLREGFKISARTDSLKRHFEATHRGMQDEDHIIHLLWNFMAIYHVCHVFPSKNDLIDFEKLRSLDQQDKKKEPSYAPTTSLQKITAENYAPSSVLKLDWNEGTIPPPPSVRQALVNFVASGDGHYLKWYPKLGGGEELVTKLANYAGVIPENIMVTNGSDDALILLCQTFLRNGEVVLAPVPTYEHFCVNAVNCGGKLIRMDLGEKKLSPHHEEVTTAIEKHQPTVVYLVSPNNPLGTQWRPKEVKNLAVLFPKVIFIIDEAYHEFATVDEGSKSPISCAKLAAELENVVCTRTFSKAFCLASIRCGYMICHPNTIETLRVRYNPKSVNMFAQIAASQALDEFNSYYKPYIHAINESRNHFMQDLEEKGIKAFNGGGGNFACVYVPSGDEGVKQVCDKLEKDQIYVRNISARFPSHFRVTVGEDMTRVRNCIIAVFEELGLLKKE